MADRKMMDEALKIMVIPALRKQGFKGSLPHFRRRNDQNIDLITFQFNNWGGSFVVELASCPTEGTTMPWGESIPPNKVTAHHMYERFRLGSNALGEDGTWFSFEKADSEEDYARVAKDVLDQLKTSDTTWISSFFAV